MKGNVAMFADGEMEDKWNRVLGTRNRGEWGNGAMYSACVVLSKAAKNEQGNDNGGIEANGNRL